MTNSNLSFITFILDIDSLSIQVELKFLIYTNFFPILYIKTIINTGDSTLHMVKKWEGHITLYYYTSRS